MSKSSPTPSEQAAELMELLGLSEDELCRILDVDPLGLISGQLEHAAQLPILLGLLAEARDQLGTPTLRSWVRTAGPAGTPIEALLGRDFALFEDALAVLERRGFSIGGRGAGESGATGGGAIGGAPGGGEATGGGATGDGASGGGAGSC